MFNLKRFEVIALAVLFITSPALVSAQSLADLQAQIQALLSQISALQSQVTQTSPILPTVITDQPDDYGTGVTVGNYCPKLSVTMQKGSRDATTGGQVSELQTFLTDYFNLDENIVVGGYFGNLTHKYLTRFQSEQGLPAFGIAGQLTRAKIAQVCGGGNIPQPYNPVSIKITSPNTEAYYYYGQPLTVSWTQNGLVPRDSIACVTLRSESTGNHFAFPSDGAKGNCVGVAGAEPERSISGIISRTPTGGNEIPGYDLAPGAYRAVVHVSQLSTPNGRDGVVLARDESDVYFKILEQNPNAGITVTAPNGGEQWEIGQLNTITWAPYGYSPDTNPARDVDVILEYAETKDSAGKIMDTGKASLHTYFNLNDYQTWAKPGKYYVSVVNRVTKVMDRSDAPFTLLPKSVDVKINGSDEGGIVVDNQPLTVSWKTANHTFSTCILNGVRQSPGSYPYGEIPVSTTGGSGTYYAASPSLTQPNVYSVIALRCTTSGGEVKTDYASIQSGDSSTPTSLQVVSPNGGEQVLIGIQYNTRITISGLKTLSVALYKNDQWKGWIQKDLPVSGSGTISVGWIPTAAEADAPGTVYKIYATGQKADGSGYVDDKSDAPFGFTSGTTGAGTLTVTSVAPVSYGRIVNVQYSNIPTGWNARIIGVNGTAQTLPVTTTSLLTLPGSYTGNSVAEYYVPNAGTSFAAIVVPNSAPSGSYVIEVSDPSSWATKLRTPAFFIGSSIPVTTGTLSVSTDSSSPAYQIVAGGSTGVTLGVYRLRATGEAIKVNKLNTFLSNEPGSTGSPMNVVQLYVYSGTTLIGNGFFAGAGSNSTITLASPLTIQKDADSSITIKADLSRIGVGQPGIPGDLIRLELASAEGVGVNSGQYIGGNNNERSGLEKGASKVSGVRIFRSYPTVAQVPLPTDGLADGRLLRFSVTASPGGAIGIGKLSFAWSSANTSAPNALDVYAYTDSSFSSPIPGGPHLGGTSQVSGTLTITPSSPVEIAAGATYYFEVRGNVTPLTGGASFSMRLVGESVSTGVGNSFDTLNAAGGSFIWSPNDMTTTQFSDNDWTTGYGISGLPQSGISQTRTGSGVVTPTTGTYKGYLNGNLFITTADISQADALANCKLNSVNNPTKSIRCTWNETVIYNADAIVSENIPAQTGTFSSSGGSGTVPALVTFTGSGLSAGTYTIDFGDGQNSGPLTPDSSGSVSVAHTYTTAGLYYIKLSNGSQQVGEWKLFTASAPTSSEGARANLANALSALESALKALIGKLGQ